MTGVGRLALISMTVMSLGIFQGVDATPDISIFPEWTIGEKLGDSLSPFPPLPPELREGSTYDQQKVVNAFHANDNVWYVVPKWLAGEFAYGEMELAYRKDLVTNKLTYPETIIPASKSGRHRGMLVDKKNNIWQLSKGGISGASTQSMVGRHHVENYLKGKIISPAEYVEISESIDFIVDQKSKISEVTRMRRWRDFLVRDKGAISVNLQEMRFNQDGKPIALDKVDGDMNKLHNFEPLTAANEPSNGAYAEAVEKLRAFLKSVGKEADAP